MFFEHRTLYVKVFISQLYTGGLRPLSANTRTKISPTMKDIHARLTATAAIPVKPNTAAMMAIIKKVTAQPITAILLVIFRIPLGIYSFMKVPSCD